MSLIIRDGNKDDFQAISNLIMEVHNLHQENRPDVYNKVDTVLEPEEFQEFLDSDDYKMFVVEDTDNKELAAYCGIKFTTTPNMSILVKRKIAYIDDLTINAAYKRKGLGKMLFNHSVEYAKSQGAHAVELMLWEFNQDASAFYEKMGMKTKNKKMELIL